MANERSGSVHFLLVMGCLATLVLCSASQAVYAQAQADPMVQKTVRPAENMEPVIHHTGHPGPWGALGWIALVGGLTGLGCATAFEVATSMSVGLIVGGKPIVSWTAFGVIMFELTLLFAGIANFSALVILSAFTRRWFPRRAREQVTSERIVIVVPVHGVPEERKRAIRGLLSQAGEVLP